MQSRLSKIERAQKEFIAKSLMSDGTSRANVGDAHHTLTLKMNRSGMSKQPLHCLLYR